MEEGKRWVTQQKRPRSESPTGGGSSNPQPPSSSRIYDGTIEERADSVKQFIKSLKFSRPLSVLRAFPERRPCPKCNRKRQFYCYNCLCVATPEVHPPPLALPLDVHVLFEGRESRSKSTVMAAATISPQVHIHNYPDFPEGIDPSSAVLLFPSADATPIDELDSLQNIKHALFVDATWQKAGTVTSDPRLQSFKRVKIRNRVSLFWRFQNFDPSHLATIEAIYYFLRDFIVFSSKDGATSTSATATDDDGQGDASSLSTRPLQYHGEVDDLLFYYINQFVVVQEYYSRKGAKEFNARHFEDYHLAGTTWDDVTGGTTAAASTNDEKSHDDHTHTHIC